VQHVIDDEVEPIAHPLERARHRLPDLRRRMRTWASIALDPHRRADVRLLTAAMFDGAAELVAEDVAVLLEHGREVPPLPARPRRLPVVLTRDVVQSAFYYLHPQQTALQGRALGQTLVVLRQALRASACGYVDLRDVAAELARLVPADRQHAAAG
jgi:hypothetical protein